MSIYLLKSRFQKLLRPTARFLVRSGLTANIVTVTACLVSFAIGALLIRAPRQLFAIVPIWMLIRMALNAIDGLMAREFDQKSPLGAYLNELSDVLADSALYLPFAFVVPFSWRSIGAVILAATIAEMAGVLGVLAGASRRYDGPMGKSDRALVFGILGLAVAVTSELPAWTNTLIWFVVLALVLTIANRVRGGLRELNSPKVSPDQQNAISE